MEDLFRKIPSLVKSSSRGSSSSSSRSTTPSPPPATLPPPLPAPDIPIQLPVGPLLPPPFITAGNSLGTPISLPPPSLTQTAVSQRDRAARVFEHSPLSNQLSSSDAASQYQQQKEQIEKQRGRYRFRGESVDTRKSASRSLSPRGKPNEKVQKKKKHGTLIPPLSPTVSPAGEGIPIKEPRSGPATTFEEILGIDGAECVSPNDLAFYVSGSSATAFGTGFATRRMRKDPITSIMEVYSDSDAPSWAGEDYPVTESTRPSFFCEADPPLGVIFSCSRNEIEPLSRPSVQTGLSTYATDDGVYPQEIVREWVGPKCTGLGLHIDPHGGIAPLLLPPTSEASVSGTKHGSYIPQVDGSFVSQSQNLTDPNLAEFPRLPDPFGLRAAMPTEEAVRVSEEGRRISFLQRCKDFIRLNSKNIRARVVHALTTGPNMNNNIDFEMDLGEAEEDIGTRKAKAVARCWSRTDLVVCYSCIVVLTVYFSLGYFHSVFIIKEALNYWAAKGEIKIYQFELALSMLTVTRILGIMSFAKLTNVYSRPCALFTAVIFAIGGVGISAFAVTWESFCAGHALFHFGRSGALVVAQVIVADTSDLSWRGCFTWGLEFGSVFWVWSTPVVEKLITRKIGWHVPIWTFFSFAFPVAIPPLTATYLYHRRILRLRLFPRRDVHQRVWWSLRGFSNKLSFFGIELDFLGILLWTVGVGLLTTALSLSEKMQAGIGMWMGVLLVGGGLTIITLVVWEVWLNNGLKTIRRLERQKTLYSGHPVRLIDHYRHTGSSSNVALDERTAIHGPAGCDSVSVDRVAAQISARILESQDTSMVQAKWRGLSSCRQRSHPLFRARLLKRRNIPLGCLIGFLANFSMRTGSWVVWERPELLPLDYRQLVEFVQGGEILTNIGFTTLIMGGLFVSLIIQITKLFKWFVVSGLLLIMCGLLTFNSAEICIIGQRQLIFVQIFTGLGAGMVDIGLMIGVQASCKRHSDVAISIGLLTTFNAVGGVTAEAMKRLMQTYLLSLLPAGSSREGFVRALNGHWSVMLLVASAAAAFALVMAGVGLAGHNLDEVEQHVAGVVFGTDDAERQNSDEGHINRNWATPRPFIPHPRDANIQPFQLASAPLDTIEEGTQVGWNNAPPRPRHLKGPTSTGSRAQGSSKSNVIGSCNSMQACESTADWETFASESITSSTSNSCTVTSPVRVASSYMDGVFTMDMDMEKTPRGTAPSIPKPYDDFSKDFASSLLVGTPTSDVQNTIKRDHYKSRQAVVVTESSVMDGEGFSFKKRKIGVINQRQASSWNNRERKPILPENVISEFSVLSDDPRETTQSNLFTHDFAVGQISSEVSSEDLKFTPDGVEGPNIQGRLTSEIDGRVSRFSYRNEEPALIQISSKSQLSVVDITSEVNALTEKNSCSLEQCLSPIVELSSRDSLEDATTSTLEESLSGGSLSSREPTVIGLLSPNHLRMQDGPKEEGRASLREGSIPATTARRNGKGVQKNKMTKDNRNRWAA